MTVEESQTQIFSNQGKQPNNTLTILNESDSYDEEDVPLSNRGRCRQNGAKTKSASQSDNVPPSEKDTTKFRAVVEVSAVDKNVIIFQFDENEEGQLDNFDQVLQPYTVNMRNVLKNYGNVSVSPLIAIIFLSMSKLN